MSPRGDEDGITVSQILQFLGIAAILYFLVTVIAPALNPPPPPTPTPTRFPEGVVPMMFQRQAGPNGGAVRWEECYIPRGTMEDCYARECITPQTECYEIERPEEDFLVVFVGEMIKSSCEEELYGDRCGYWLSLWPDEFLEEGYGVE